MEWASECHQYLKLFSCLAKECHQTPSPSLFFLWTLFCPDSQFSISSLRNRPGSYWLIPLEWWLWIISAAPLWKIIAHDGLDLSPSQTPNSLYPSSSLGHSEKESDIHSSCVIHPGKDNMPEPFFSHAFDIAPFRKMQPIT